jgi:hypothetical protein
MRKWVAAFAGGVLVTGVGAFLAVQGLDRADKWSSVFGMFVSLAGLFLAAAGAAGGRLRGGKQSVVDATIGGGVTQVHGVRGNLRPDQACAPARSPATRVAPVPSSGAVPPADGVEQTVTRSSTAGPVRQISDIGGDVELGR